MTIKQVVYKKTVVGHKTRDNSLFTLIKEYSNMTSFFRFVNKRAIYRFGYNLISTCAVYVTDYPVIKVHVDELLSARIGQHKLCATLSANIDINYRLPIKIYCRICTVRHIRIKIINGLWLRIKY